MPTYVVCGQCFREGGAAYWGSKVPDLPLNVFKCELVVLVLPGCFLQLKKINAVQYTTALHFVIPMECTGRFNWRFCMKYRIISIWIMVMMASPFYALGP